jgi:thioesterase domain-containing protein
MRYYKERFTSMNSDYSYYDMIRFILHKSFGNVTKPFRKAPPPKFIRTTAYSNYTYKPYSGRVVLFQATNRPLEIDDSPMMGWSDYFTGEVDLISISGGHLGMFREPAIRKTAEELNGILKKVNNTK